MLCLCGAFAQGPKVGGAHGSRAGIGGSTAVRAPHQDSGRQGWSWVSEGLGFVSVR